MTYSNNRHFSPEFKKWDKTKAADFANHLFESTEKAFSPDKGWRHHGSESDELMEEYPRCLYRGLTGIIWSQNELAELGFGSIKNNYDEVLSTACEEQELWLERNADYKNKPEYLPGLLLGKLGIKVVQWKLQKAVTDLKDVVKIICENQSNTICEYMWGSAGSISVGMDLIGLEQDEQLTGCIQNSVDFLKQTLVTIPNTGIKLWNQYLYGERKQLLGAVHGFAGNAFSIIKSFPLLNENERLCWSDTFSDTLKRSAYEDSSGANWTKTADVEHAASEDFLVQMCHRAPGIICCTSKLMNQGDTDFDRLLLKAGELVWTAGPLTKGANLCHGTAGNGYAFLKLFDATHDEMWLERARSFAMVAIDQVEEKREEYRDYHYSLWSGDTGVTHFIASCLSESSKIPTMDYI